MPRRLDRARHAGGVSIESLGGYRLVRKLGEGPRAEVYLAHPDREGVPPAVIKVYRDGVAVDSIDAEVEALARATGEHTVRLVDLTTAPDGAPALILERLGSGSLGRLLHERGAVRPGEAITILAPLAGALARLHAAGVVHGAIRLDAVLFDVSGTPTLACFGRASLLPPSLPAARLEAEPGVAIDLRSFGGVARAVLGSADGGQELIAWMDDATAAGRGWLEELPERLFALAEPEPVDFRATRPEQRSLPPRVIGEPVVEPHRPSALAALALPEWLESVLGENLQRVRGALRAVRARVWVAAGAVALALVAALVLVPGGGGSDATAEPSAPATSSAAPIVDRGPVSGDDPMAALLALLETRERCIRDLSVLCLDDVDQAGSAALADDAALVRAVQDGGELPTLIEASEPVLVERLGDSAIVGLGPDSEPASVLLMKGEAGWRIRDYLAE